MTPGKVSRRPAILYFFLDAQDAAINVAGPTSDFPSSYTLYQVDYGLNELVPAGKIIRVGHDRQKTGRTNLRLPTFGRQLCRFNGHETAPPWYPHGQAARLRAPM